MCDAQRARAGAIGHIRQPTAVRADVRRASTRPDRKALPIAFVTRCRTRATRLAKDIAEGIEPLRRRSVIEEQRTIIAEADSVPAGARDQLRCFVWFCRAGQDRVHAARGVAVIACISDSVLGARTR